MGRTRTAALPPHAADDERRRPHGPKRAAPHHRLRGDRDPHGAGGWPSSKPTSCPIRNDVEIAVDALCALGSCEGS
jgi:hypothetical protein